MQRWFLHKKGDTMSLEWSKDMEVGNLQIDREHKQLFDKINDFYNACNQGKGKEECLSILGFLKQYTVTHFQHEEALQEKYGYPHIEKHKLLHRSFVQSVEDIEQHLQKEGISISTVVEINQKIGFWLINHIKKEDTKIAHYIRQL